MPKLSAQTQEIKKVRSMTFQIVKNRTTIVKTHTLVLAPEEFDQDEPARVTITRTIGGAYVEEWGLDLPEVSIKGTTGYKLRQTPNGEMDGFQAFKDLRDNIYRYFLEPDGTLKQKRDNKDTFELKWFNWEDDEYYVIQPKSFKLLRNKSQPLLYGYSLQFTCLRPIAKGLPPKEDPVIRNTSSFEAVLPKTIQTLADYATSIEFLFEENYWGNEGIVEKDEVLTESNFTGLSKIPSFYGRLKGIIEYSRGLVLKLIDYNRGISSAGSTTLTIETYASEVASKAEEIRSFATEISKIAKPPAHLLWYLRELQSAMALIATFKDKFKGGR